MIDRLEPCEMNNHYSSMLPLNVNLAACWQNPCIQSMTSDEIVETCEGAMTGEIIASRHAWQWERRSPVGRWAWVCIAETELEAG